jgi:hypothetical protein
MRRANQGRWMTNGTAAGTHHMTDIAVTPNVAVFNDELGFLLQAGIVAPPPHGNPLWMLVDPLRDVGLRTHDALIQRHASRERKMQIFALTR